MQLVSINEITKNKRIKGITLIEILIVIVIGAIIASAALSLYVMVSKTYSKIKPLLITKETAKTGLDQLEWFFQRWGFGVPCNNPANTIQCINVYVDNSTSDTFFPYAPPSSLYIRIKKADPCDEIWFYGSLGGEGFVTRMVGTNKVAVMSCRLSDNDSQNCYHIWRGAKHFYNSNSTIDLNKPSETGYNTEKFDLSVNNNKEFPIIFKISGLSENNLDCSRETNPDNAEMDIIATAYGGEIEDYNGTQQILTKNLKLEGQDLLVRVPHLIHFFCKNNSQDNNNLWLYVETTDISINCTSNEPEMPIVRVNSFKVNSQNNGILVTLEIVSEKNTAIRVERFYGR